MNTGEKLWAGSRKETAPLKAKSLTVDITMADIKQGLECDPNHCVVACAIQRAHPTYKRIAVDAATIRYTEEQKDGTRLRHVLLTPPPLQRIVVATDQGLKKYLKPVRATAIPAFIHVSNPPGRKKKNGASEKKRAAIKKLAKNPVVRSRGKGGNVPIVIGGVELPRISQRRGFGLRGAALMESEAKTLKKAA
jgi:hypothetical protein